MGWVIEFEISLPRSWIRVAGAGALMLSVVPDLGSETVSLANYYASPSGYHNKLSTIGNAQLGRANGGRIRIGDNGVAGLDDPTVTVDVTGDAKFNALDAPAIAARHNLNCVETAATTTCVGKYATFIRGVYANEMSGPERYSASAPGALGSYYCCTYPTGGSRF